MVDFDKEFKGLFAMDFRNGSVFSGNNFSFNDGSNIKKSLLDLKVLSDFEPKAFTRWRQKECEDRSIMSDVFFLY